MAEEASAERREMRKVLVELIRVSGQPREDKRILDVRELQHAQEAAARMADISEVAVVDSGDASVGKPAPFCADLVYAEEAGFELWLGSLEDALSLEGLKRRNIDGILNCALEECIAECRTFRCGESEPKNRGRCRTHARGASLAADGEAKTKQKTNMPADVLRGLVEFDQSWYSDFLDCDMAYYGIAAADEDGYRMDNHFEEACQFIEMCRLERRKVLVHCIMGINRSSLALVAFLCSGLGMPLSDAIGLASRQRGWILSNNSFIDQLVTRFGVPQAVNAEPTVSGI